MRKFIGFMLIVAVSCFVASSAMATEGLLVDWGIPVEFVDANADGNVESLKNTDDGSTAYTFADPIAMPAGGDVVEISGDISFYGYTLPGMVDLVLVF